MMNIITILLLFLILLDVINGYLCSSSLIKIPLKKNLMNSNIILNINDNNNSNDDIINSDIKKAEGYLGSDLSTLDNDKQSRVLLYISIALLPCLFLIPFFMSRDFVPPTDDVSPFSF